MMIAKTLKIKHFRHMIRTTRIFFEIEKSHHRVSRFDLKRILGPHNYGYSTPEPYLTEFHFRLGHRLHLSSDPSSVKPLFLPQAT